jgi:hypothetical protein
MNGKSELQEMKEEIENGNIQAKSMGLQEARDIIAATAEMTPEELNAYADELAAQNGVTGSQARMVIRLTIASAMVALEKEMS